MPIHALAIIRRLAHVPSAVVPVSLPAAADKVGGVASALAQPPKQAACLTGAIQDGIPATARLPPDAVIAEVL